MFTYTVFALYPLLLYFPNRAIKGLIGNLQDNNRLKTVHNYLFSLHFILISNPHNFLFTSLFFIIQIVKDVKFTVHQAVEPVEKGITRFNEKLFRISQNIKKHDKDKRRIKDDSCIASSPARRVIRGIDDPLLNGSVSDSAMLRGKKHRRKSGSMSGESGGESSSDQTYGGYQVRGHRWVTKE